MMTMDRLLPLVRNGNSLEIVFVQNFEFALLVHERNT